MNDKYQNRPLRSFVARESRMSIQERQALRDLWPIYGLHTQDGTFPFLNEKPWVMEIGFGGGEHLFAQAKRHPDWQFVGVEVHRPGVGALMLKLHAEQIPNVHIYAEDVWDVLTKVVPDESLSQVFLLFPDPWPKRRHHKRRLLNPLFVDTLVKKLKPGGIFHAATDWEDYAIQMLNVLSNTQHLTNLSDNGTYIARPARIETRFEARGLQKGHAVRDLSFMKR